MKKKRWGRSRRRLGFKQKLMFLLVFAAALVLAVECALAPVIENVALQQAHNKTVLNMNRAVQHQLQQRGDTFDYQELMHIERDEEGHITMLAPQTQVINQLVTDIVLEMETQFSLLNEQKLSVPLLSLFGSRLFASRGPELPVYFRSLATPNISIKDEFSSAGINQVRHRIYAEICTTVQIVVPFSSYSTQVSSTVLLAEAIIVGYTPETYVEFSLPEDIIR